MQSERNMCRIIYPKGELSFFNKTYGNFECMVVEDEIWLAGYNQEPGVTEIIIPSEIDGKKVTRIQGAFKNVSNLTSIVIRNFIRFQLSENSSN